MAALCMVNTLNLESFRINGPKKVFTGIFLDPLVITSQWLFNHREDLQMLEAEDGN